MEIINKDNFEELVENSKVPVLVDFFATWCMPCKMMSPILDSVQENFGDNLKIYKVDVDQSPELAKKFGVMAVPTIILFDFGTEVEKIVGIKQVDAMNELIDPYINK